MNQIKNFPIFFCKIFIIINKSKARVILRRSNFCDHKSIRDWRVSVTITDLKDFVIKAV